MRLAGVALLVVLLAACDKGSRPEPVVVYAASDAHSSLHESFAAFTAESDIPVTVRLGEPASNVANVIGDHGSPPPDILITTTIGDIWRAAEQGALRPIQSSNLRSLPDTLRDPDGLWFALTYHAAVIVMADDLGMKRQQRQPQSYADLGDDAYRGQLCLASSTLPAYRSLIAMLIHENGRRPAELIVRGWVRNLALPPFSTELKLLNAIRAGTCDYGIIHDNMAEDVTVIWPEVTHIDIEGVGIARHSRYPESAQQLVNWLLAESDIELHVQASDANVGIAGWNDEEARLLAERASYR